MIPGETIASGASDECCGIHLVNEVLKSAAGYYIGTLCNNCGPYSRESGYYPTRVSAEEALSNNTFYR